MTIFTYQFKHLFKTKYNLIYYFIKSENINIDRDKKRFNITVMLWSCYGY